MTNNVRYLANNIKEMPNKSAQGSVNQRLTIIVDTFEKGIKSAFAAKIGISAQGVHDLLSGRKGSPSFKVLSSILESYPALNANWLVLGRGPMLQDSEALTAPATIAIDGQPHSLTQEQWEAIQKAILEMTPAKAAAQVETEWMGRTYHFGDERTPGLPYDDRFSMRVGITGDDLQEFMNTPEQFDQLRHIKIGNRIIVTERAIREWTGDIPKAV